MTQIARLAVAGVGSVLVHIAAAALILPMLAARPVPQQVSAQSELALATVRVAQNRAAAQTPKAEAATPVQSAGARIGSGGVARTRATALALTAPAALVKPAIGVRAQATRPTSERVTAESANGVRQTASLNIGKPQAATLPKTPVASAVRDAGMQAAQIMTALMGEIAKASKAVGTKAAATSTAGVSATPALLTETSVTPSRPEVTAISAGLVWSGAGNMALDTQAVATLAALLEPGSFEGEELRDQMTKIMAAPRCARIHTVFDPANGTLDLRGHVPNAAARAPLLAALRSQIGDGLPLRDMLRVLPEPQCGVLDGIASLGLPQSEEQLTDSDLVGENAQVREYAFAEGDRLSIDLSAPDYPAYIYVDYFDAVGQVIHLRPNAKTEFGQVAAEAVFSIGRGDDIDLRIAPPFGQDIAVAFATSVPLYSGLRPLVEPAAPYLSELRQRIEFIRQSEADFRGEWAYLFVATGPKAGADDTGN